MEIVSFGEDHLNAAAALFVQHLKKLRQIVPVLPDAMEDPNRVAGKLRSLMDSSHSFAAVEDSQLLGYMGWYTVDHFRGTVHRGAYCPVWAHACDETDRSAVYTKLYRAAAIRWTDAGCQVHAVSLLANDPAVEKIWFWNGFGLTVVDAIRPMLPLGIPYRGNLTIRKAQIEDADTITLLDAEHWRHYSASPIFMVPQPPADAAGNVEFLSQSKNSIWLAFCADEPAGFIRFEGHSHGATDIVESATTVAITGAYTIPRFRGQRAAPALLDAALRHYRELGFERCSVDFESFNPEAAQFWMKYFEPVCLSVMRHPEALGV